MMGFVNLFSPVSKWTLHSVVVVTLLVLLNLDSVLSAFYTNQVAVHIEGGPEEAHVIAKRHGFINLGQIGVLEDHYLFEHPHIVKRSTSASQEHGERLEAEPQVRWFEQQVVLSRKKRAFTETPYTMTDPNWSDQWYLNRTNHMDMNVIPAWLKGYTGKGVVITILDDGIERNHTDLVENYDPEASYDINDRDADPFPRYDYTNENRHGTRCAGEVSASANNSMCGVGVAFRSKIGGVRMLDGDVTDAVEAAALSLNPQHIDIYSASWGPDDDGKVVDGPGKLAKLSFLNGITKGRNGKGSIFVWASGNGGNAHDSCNCDGYTNSIFTLSVSSTSELGNKPWYLEECSSTLATTYSSGGYRQRQIVTTDLHNLCTKTHTGTSAAAPLAAGIVALVLEANPNLTWRDVQYITMLTARTDPFIDADFVVNSMGRKVSLRYGYGLMDTSAMVDMAESWTNVPLQHTCEKSGEQTNVPLTGTPYSATIDADGCTGQGNAIKFLEHVQINVTLSYSRRGDISLHLTSPKGTTSTLLPQRQNDRYTGAFQNWPFMSVHFWGEDPTGTWKLEINNEGAASNHGTLTAWSLRLHGTATDPLANTAVTTTQTGKPTLQPTPVTCHSECDGHCNGSKPEDCVKCKHFKLGEHGACVGVCPNSTFVNDVSRECVKCDGTCHTCRGSSGTDCNTCFGGWFLMTENSTCVMECPDGFYEEDPSGRCSHCAENCLTCQGTANTCTSCKAGEQLQNGACYGPGTCLETQFKNAEGLCEVCHITCGTCSGRTLHNCTSCVMDNSLTTYLEKNMCVLECSHGYYVTHVNQLKLQSCQRCDSSCLTCTGPAPSDCSSCESSLTLTSGQCLSGNIDCAPGQYMNSGQCLDCHATCLTCKGATHTDCLTCSEGSSLGSGECTSGCVTGTYPVTTNQPRNGILTVCTSCHGSCASCHGPTETDCITCRPPLQVQGNFCTPKACPDRQYLDLVKHTCEHCHRTCDTCKGSGIRDCLSCSSSYLLGGGCVYCTPGFYPSTDACQPCMGHCEECTGPDITTCQKCSEGFELGAMGCIRKCDIGQFLNDNDKDCSPCFAGCASCTGEYSNNCHSCIAPLLHDATSHRCLPCCSSESSTDCCSCRPGQTIGECVLNPPHSPAVDTEPVKVSVKKDQDSTISSSFAGLIVGFCLLPIIISAILFSILQLRSNHKLCWKHNYTKVPLTFDPVSEKLSSAVLSFGDDDDEELFTNDKNMDPNHNKDASREEY